MKKLSALMAAILLSVGFLFAAPSAEGNGNEGGQQGQAVSQTTTQYQANFEEIESLFENAESVTESVPFDQIEQAMSAPEGVNSDGSLIAAIILCFFLGGLAIHRVIMGGRAILILLYLITCGGIFGIVPLVDFILLIVDAINGGGSRFENNDKFIAW
jgi:hypothetical protein